MTLPFWFRQEIPNKRVLSKIGLIRSLKVDTVCRQARCPNVSKCLRWSGITFMLLGDTCSRNCKFCAVKKTPGKLSLDLSEPFRIAEAVKELSLSYIIITSVTRDDLKDGGAGQFAKTLQLIRRLDPSKKVEVLIPDFKGDQSALKCLLESAPNVVAHNMETVKRLYKKIRPQANYQLSLELLSNIKKIEPQMLTKSSLMLGMGETESEIIGLMLDLRKASCDIITLGQYLAPGQEYYPVKRFVLPKDFIRYKKIALALGFKAALSGPLVRSSYKAEYIYRSFHA